MQGWSLMLVTTSRKTGRSPTRCSGRSISAPTVSIWFVQGTGPVGGTGTGGGTGTDRRGESSGISCSEVMGGPEGPDTGTEDGPGAGPAAPGCDDGGGDAEAASGGGEACWGADALARLAVRVMAASEVMVGVVRMATAQATSTSTVVVDTTASQRRLQ